MAKRTSTTDKAPTPTGPADTTHPDTRVSSVTPNTADAAVKGQPTVAATVQRPGGRPSSPQHTARPSRGRTETYTTTRPDGSKVKVTRDLDTGQASYDEA